MLFKNTYGFYVSFLTVKDCILYRIYFTLCVCLSNWSTVLKVSLNTQESTFMEVQLTKEFSLTFIHIKSKRPSKLLVYLE